MIRLENITKSFADGKKRLDVLKGASLSVSRGEMVAVMGRSGSGKTTLMHILAGLIRPDGGQYLFDGHDMVRCGEGELAAFRNRQTGYVMQNNALLYDRSVFHNIMLPMQFLKGIPYSEKEARVCRLAEQMGILDKLRQNPKKLSGGEQQRAAIARALVMDPPLILADEPTGALDEETEKEILDILQALNEQGKTLILITHDQSVARRCEKTYLLQGGRFA